MKFIKTNSSLSFIVIITFVFLGLVGSLSFFQNNNLKQIEKRWQEYQDKLEAKASTLDELKELIGYGGVIHHFKNYLLRSEVRYYDEALEKFKEAFLKIRQLKSYSNLTPVEKDAISTIEETLLIYQEKLKKLYQLHLSNRSIQEKDRIVKVPDRETIQAFNLLKSAIDTQKSLLMTRLNSELHQSRRLIEILTPISLLIFLLVVIFLGHKLQKNHKQLVETNKVLRFLQDETNDGWWDWHIQKDYEYMSPSFWETLGYDSQKKRHHPDEWRQLVHEEDLNQVESNFNKHVETQGKHPYDQEVRYHHADGSLVTVICRGKIIEWDEEKRPLRMVGTHVNVTKVKEAQEELRQTNEFKSQFLSNVSHELRSPLNTLVLMTKVLLENREGTLTPKQLENLELMDHACTDLHMLINDLLDHAKIEKGVMDIQARSVSIEEIAKDTLNMFQEQFRHKGVTFIVENQSRKGSQFVTDPYRVEQIIRNLVSNALKFTASEGKVVVSFDLFKRLTKTWLRVKVQDTGVGINVHSLDEIFVQFKQLPEGKIRKHQGTGLGLSISKHIAMLLNGQIEVKSQSGVGSEFVLVIPEYELVPDKPSNTHVLEKKTRILSKEELAILEGKYVLIVDDDVKNLFVLRQILDQKKMNLRQARSGPDALSLCEKGNPIDLVLMDIMMPEMDGYVATQEIKKIEHMRKVPFVAMSGHLSQHSEQAPGHLFESFLTKPISINDLFKTLIKLLDK